MNSDSDRNDDEDSSESEFEFSMSDDDICLLAAAHILQEKKRKFNECNNGKKKGTKIRKQRSPNERRDRDYATRLVEKLRDPQFKKKYRVDRKGEGLL